jgi:predicted DsbA family dithiol-disulfide isomerase
MLVEIWSDIVCPWCYIGKRRFESALARFEHADQVEVQWRSFELDPNAPFRRSGDMAHHLAAKYGMTVEDATERLHHMDQMAAQEGLRYDLARSQGGNTFAAHRLIHLGYQNGPATGAALKEALLHAYFVDLRPISEPDALMEVGIAAGLDPDEVTDLLESDRFAAEVRHDEAEAAALGCTGVPFFVFDRAFAVPGAQDSETFLITLRRAWDRSHPTLEVLPVPAAGQADEGVCSDDSCAI